VAWADEYEPGRQLFARVRPNNIASQRVGVRAGLRRAPSLDDIGEDSTDHLFIR
jgi:hypothetical protein